MSKWLCAIVFTHYDPVFAKVVTPNWPTAGFQYIISVFRGDPASPIIVNIIYQMCINYADRHVIYPHVFTNTHVDLTAMFGSVALRQLVYADEHTTVKHAISGAQPTFRLIYTWLA